LKTFIHETVAVIVHSITDFIIADKHAFRFASGFTIHVRPTGKTIIAAISRFAGRAGMEL